MPEIFAVLLDLNSYQLKENKALQVFEEFLLHLNVLINTFFTLNPKNKFLLYTLDSQRVELIFPKTEQHMLPYLEYNFSEGFKIIKEEIFGFLCRKDPDTSNYSRVTQAISLALCTMNKIKKNQEGYDSKILLVSNASVPQQKLLKLMECIEGAKKLHTLIDVLVLQDLEQVTSEQERSNLKQISFLTGGAHISINEEDLKRLTQYFNQIILTDVTSRKRLKMPRFVSSAPATGTGAARQLKHNQEPHAQAQGTSDTGEKVLFYSACVCCRKETSQGSLCSLCLSLYCERGARDLTVCIRCKNPFTANAKEAHQQ